MEDFWTIAICPISPDILFKYWGLGKDSVFPKTRQDSLHFRWVLQTGKNSVFSQTRQTHSTLDEYYRPGRILSFRKQDKTHSSRPNKTMLRKFFDCLWKARSSKLTHISYISFQFEVPICEYRLSWLGGQKYLIGQALGQVKGVRLSGVIGVSSSQ